MSIINKCKYIIIVSCILIASMFVGCNFVNNNSESQEIKQEESSESKEESNISEDENELDITLNAIEYTKGSSYNSTDGFVEATYEHRFYKHPFQEMDLKSLPEDLTDEDTKIISNKAKSSMKSFAHLDEEYDGPGELWYKVLPEITIFYYIYEDGTEEIYLTREIAKTSKNIMFKPIYKEVIGEDNGKWLIGFMDHDYNSVINALGLNTSVTRDIRGKYIPTYYVNINDYDPLKYLEK